MKRRLRMPAPLTPEDFAIWDRISDPPPPGEPVSLFGYQESDRRDADLMLYAQQTPVDYIVRSYDPFEQRTFVVRGPRVRGFSVRVDG